MTGITLWFLEVCRNLDSHMATDDFADFPQRYMYIRVGYNLDIMRQSACLVLNPITVYSYGFLFNCTMVGQASDYDGSDVKL